MVRLFSALLLFPVLLSPLLHPPGAAAQVNPGAMRGARRLSVQVSVDDVTPGVVNIAPGGEASATIEGGGLNLSGLTLEVRKGGSSAGVKVTADLGSAGSGSSRAMTVKAGKDAAAGTYQVILKRGDTNITLPFEAKVSVKISTRKAVSTAPDSKGDGGVTPTPALTPEARQAVPKPSAAELRKRAASPRGGGRLLGRAPAIYTDTAPARIPPPSYRAHLPAAIPSHPPDPVSPPPSPAFGAKVKKMGGKFVKKADPALMQLPETTLEVRLLYKDLEKWGRHWFDSPARKLEFRWQTRAEGIAGGRWELSQGPGFGSIMLSGDAGEAPGTNGDGRFFIDFKKIAGLFNDFHVRVRPFRGQYLGTAGDGEEPSTPVRVTVAVVEQPPTEFTDPAMGGPEVLTMEVVEPEVLTSEVQEPEVLTSEVQEPEVLTIGDGEGVQAPPREAALLPGPLKPRSGDLPPVDPAALKSAGLSRLPDAFLEVKQFSGDFGKWGSYAQESTAAVFDFRVTGRVEPEAMSAIWEVAFNSDHLPNHWKSSYFCPTPKQNQTVGFSIDFRPYAEMLGEMTTYVPQYSFFIRVIYGKYPDIQHSNTVEVAVTGPSPPTEFE